MQQVDDREACWVGDRIRGRQINQIREFSAQHARSKRTGLKAAAVFRGAKWQCPIQHDTNANDNAKEPECDVAHACVSGCRVDCSRLSSVQGLTIWETSDVTGKGA